MLPSLERSRGIAVKAAETRPRLLYHYIALLVHFFADNDTARRWEIPWGRGEKDVPITLTRALENVPGIVDEEGGEGGEVNAGQEDDRFTIMTYVGHSVRRRYQFPISLG